MLAFLSLSVRFKKTLNHLSFLGLFPYTTQWNDIDYMHEKLDFTVDQQRYLNLSTIVHDLHEKVTHHFCLLGNVHQYISNPLLPFMTKFPRPAVSKICHDSGSWNF